MKAHRTVRFTASSRKSWDHAYAQALTRAIAWLKAHDCTGTATCRMVTSGGFSLEPNGDVKQYSFTLSLTAQQPAGGVE